MASEVENHFQQRNKWR